MEKILFIEPYYGGAHKYFADGFKKNIQANVKILGLPAYDWKWRMEGGAIELANQYQKLAGGFMPDKIIASSMLDLPTFLSITKLDSHIPIILYFHENQFSYPKKNVKNTDYHYGFIQYKSALTADYLFFNSLYNKETFYNGLSKLLKALPKHNYYENLKYLESKSHIVPLGFDYKEIERYRVKKNENASPIILWNHRWEHDKNPEDFFNTIISLNKERINFTLVVLGKQSNNYPVIFDQAKKLLKDKILFWGYCDDKSEYYRWLWQADIMPVTSNQDFFGISVVESIICDVYPLLPYKLAYPEHFLGNQKDFFYQKDKFKKSLKELIISKSYQTTRPEIKDYSWEKVIERFKEILN